MTIFLPENMDALDQNMYWKACSPLYYGSSLAEKPSIFCF